MMRLVVEYQVSDGYTFWCTDTEPVEYDSAEAFAVAFEEEYKEADKIKAGEFLIAGKTWQRANHCYYSEDKDCLIYDAPNVMTVDEWFERK